MTNGARRSAGSPVEKLREIPKCTERYARNRVLPFILWLLGVQIFTMIFTMGLCSLTLLLKRGGHPVLIILSIVFNASVVAGMLWMTVTGRLSRIFQSLTEKVYREEGSAVPTSRSRRAARGPRWYLGAALGGFALPCLLILAMFFFLQVVKVPPAYIQPAMATVIVPALIVLALVSPDDPKWLGVIPPMLYAMHAVLMLAGVRLSVFGVGDLAGRDQLFPTGQQILEVSMPLFAYGMLWLITRHIYSRVALRRLRTLARTPESANGAEEAGR